VKNGSYWFILFFFSFFVFAYIIIYKIKYEKFFFFLLNCCKKEEHMNYILQKKNNISLHNCIKLHLQPSTIDIFSCCDNEDDQNEEYVPSTGIV
jgi:hypothetical protein